MHILCAIVLTSIAVNNEQIVYTFAVNFDSINIYLTVWGRRQNCKVASFWLKPCSFVISIKTRPNSFYYYCNVSSKLL